MDRRNFVKTVVVCNLGLLVSPLFGWSFPVKGSSEKTLNRYLLKLKNNNPIDISNEKRIPFGWSATGIKPGEKLFLKADQKLPDSNFLLRIAVAQDMRDKKILHIMIAGTNICLGVIDIQYSSILTSYELKINKEHTTAINNRGLEVKLEASEPLWIFDKQAQGADNSFFLPHIVSSTTGYGEVSDFLRSFMSVDSVQTFGWKEGCVLDGLWQIYNRKHSNKALETINKHLELFFDKNQHFIYELSEGIPKDNQIDSIETTLPFAILAKLDAAHPALNIAVDSWRNFTKENGMITVRNTLTAEGCYTISYPMAVIGKVWQREDLMKNALEQLKHRFLLIEENNFYLRYNAGKRTYKNWARGIAWFLLGFVRTIVELKDEIEDGEIIRKYKEVVDIALSMQRSDGLWNCFMHENSLPDTSGSAGIAAAILIGVNNGLLPQSYRGKAELCWRGLQQYITLDGFLTGSAQDNRGGIELQESDYRITSQMAMGLMAQLYAEL